MLYKSYSACSKVVGRNKMSSAKSLSVYNRGRIYSASGFSQCKFKLLLDSKSKLSMERHGASVSAYNHLQELQRS